MITALSAKEVLIRMNEDSVRETGSASNAELTVVLGDADAAKPLGRAALVVLSGWEIGLRIPIGEARILIGRSPGCDVVIPSNSVSREHAAIEPVREDGALAVYVSDLGSSNGTQVNGTPVVRARLQASDKVRMGEVNFSFVADGGEEPRPDA